MIRDTNDRMLESAMEQYGRLILTICSTMTGDRHEAEDLAQDTFVSAWRNLDHFDGANMKAWLVTIASNKCRDYLKSAARRSAPAPQETFDLVADGSPLPEHAVLERDMETRLRICCERLKEPYRAIAVSHFCEHKSPQEISAETGKNLKTTQTQIYRAKALLRTMWKEEFG